MCFFYFNFIDSNAHKTIFNYSSLYDILFYSTLFRVNWPARTFSGKFGTPNKMHPIKMFFVEIFLARKNFGENIKYIFKKCIQECILKYVKNVLVNITANYETIQLQFFFLRVLYFFHNFPYF